MAGRIVCTVYLLLRTYPLPTYSLLTPTDLPTAYPLPTHSLLTPTDILTSLPTAYPLAAHCLPTAYLPNELQEVSWWLAVLSVLKDVASTMPGSVSELMREIE